MYIFATSLRMNRHYNKFKYFVEYFPRAHFLHYQHCVSYYHRTAKMNLNNNFIMYYLQDKKNEKQERKPFDRDTDLQVNRFDEAQKKSILKKAQLLDTRFKHGKSKYL